MDEAAVRENERQQCHDRIVTYARHMKPLIKAIYCDVARILLTNPTPPRPEWVTGRTCPEANQGCPVSQQPHVLQRGCADYPAWLAAMDQLRSEDEADHRAG